MLPQANRHLCAASRKPYSIINLFGNPIRLCYNRRVPTRRIWYLGHLAGAVRAWLGRGLNLVRAAACWGTDAPSRTPELGKQSLRRKILMRKSLSAIILALVLLVPLLA